MPIFGNTLPCVYLTHFQNNSLDSGLLKPLLFCNFRTEKTNFKPSDAITLFNRFFRAKQACISKTVALSVPLVLANVTIIAYIFQKLSLRNFHAHLSN